MINELKQTLSYEYAAEDFEGLLSEIEGEIIGIANVLSTTPKMTLTEVVDHSRYLRFLAQDIRTVRMYMYENKIELTEELF